MCNAISEYAVQYVHPKTGATLTLGNFPRPFDAANLLRTIEDVEDVKDGWIVERHVTKWERMP